MELVTRMEKTKTAIIHNKYRGHAVHDTRNSIAKITNRNFCQKTFTAGHRSSRKIAT